VGKVDLHIHTTASDGKYTPVEIVQKARDNGLAYIAICDHDTTEGVIPAQQAAANFPGLTVIAGVEINTDISDGELHILGYAFDNNNIELKSTLERLKESRIGRAQKMIQKLHNLGIDIDFERVRELAGTGSVGRPHIAQAMLEKGYIGNFKEAFNRYISRGGPAYVERDKITPAEAIKLITRSRGIPVMAHPLTYLEFEPLISDLKAAGLMGLEVYYNNYSPDQIRDLLRIADCYGLIPTGGSDFHGLDGLNEIPLGTVEVPLESAERLLAVVHH
jgi:3',5'-nucleoside bisphosphate phosphatase